MIPSLVKGYDRRKLHTGNPSVQFDEEVVPERALLYSAHPHSFSRIRRAIGAFDAKRRRSSKIKEVEFVS